MTPEEKAVIQAAIELRRRIPGRDIHQKIALDDAVYKLTVTCPDCNRGGHVCPGDGNSIGHGDTDCGEHDDDAVKPSEERQHLAQQLRDIGQDTMQEWMRIVDLEDVAEIPFQVRINWQNDDGLCGVGESQYGDEYGTFRLTVSVEDLGPQQPDPAMVYEMPEVEVWVRTEMRHARVGDVIRPAGTDVDGTRVLDRYLPPRKDGGNAGHWHVVSGGPKHWDDRIVRDGEVWLVLEGAANGQPQNLDPTFPIEIRMAPQLRSMLAGNLPLLHWEDRMDAR